MNALRLAPFFVVAAFLVGCEAQASLAGKYNIEQDGYGFGPGADKIVLDLRSDKSFDVTAGPLTMLDGTWDSKEGALTFSKGQGSLLTTYRVEGAKLVPVQDGQDVTGWRWKRM